MQSGLYDIRQRNADWLFCPSPHFSHKVILFWCPTQKPTSSKQLIVVNRKQITYSSPHGRSSTSEGGIKLQIWLQAPFGSAAKAQRARLSGPITMPSMRWCFTPQNPPAPLAPGHACLVWASALSGHIGSAGDSAQKDPHLKTGFTLTALHCSKWTKLIWATIILKPFTLRCCFVLLQPWNCQWLDIYLQLIHIPSFYLTSWFHRLKKTLWSDAIKNTLDSIKKLGWFFRELGWKMTRV